MGTRIKELRKAAGLSQQELANKAGVSIRTIVYVERGRDVHVSTVAALAAALGVHVSDLFEPDEVTA